MESPFFRTLFRILYCDTQHEKAGKKNPGCLKGRDNMYFDTHIHFFPDAIAPKAMERLQGISSFPAYTNGTRKDTLEKLKGWGCIGGIALHIATNPQQQDAVNHFAAGVQGGNLLCFGSVHPKSSDVAGDVQKITKMGLRGIKLHPDYQDFFVDDTAVYPLYRAAEQAGLPIAFHTGRDPLSPQVVHCTPKSLARVAKDFPALKIIAAHMGGSYMPQEAQTYLAGLPNLWFDTAFISDFLTSPQFETLVNAFGIHRIFYASDCPWATQPQICKIIENTGLSLKDKEKIYWKNAFAFFGLSEVSAKSKSGLSSK